MTITTAPGGIEMEMHNGITIAITSEANRFGITQLGGVVIVIVVAKWQGRFQHKRAGGVYVMQLVC